MFKFKHTYRDYWIYGKIVVLSLSYNKILTFYFNPEKQLIA